MHKTLELKGVALKGGFWTQDLLRIKIKHLNMRTMYNVDAHSQT